MPGRKVWWSVLVVLAIVVTGSTTWLATRPPTAACASTDAVVSGQHLSPAAVVAMPWYGPHNVYGLFMVPEGLGRGTFTATLRVRGFQEPASLRRGRWSVGGIQPVAGHYVKRIYVPTRVALRFLVNGHFGDLRAPCHWTLEVLDQQ